MKKQQAGGYIFEHVVRDLLKKSGYISVKNKTIKGRGTDHEIDAYGVLSIPTPFIYPIRLICEAKNYSENVGLDKIRSFVGVMKDISENYVVGKKKKSERFTDAGCFFSMLGFSSNAQDYAWAQNIFLVSFNKIGIFKKVETVISDFLNNTKDLENITIKDLIVRFKGIWKKELKNIDISLLVGVLNNTYPIVLVGKKDLISKMKNKLPKHSDKLSATKASRESGEYDTVFNLNLLGIDQPGQSISFSLPNDIANKIIQKIDFTNQKKEIFSIDIPFMFQKSIRRFLTFDVFLEVKEKDSYIRNIKKQ